MSDSNTARAWLLTDRTVQTLTELIEGLARVLEEMGVPVWRFGTTVLTAHPEVFTENVTWVRGEPWDVFRVSHAMASQAPDMGLTPMFDVWRERRPIRCRLDQDDARIPWSAVRALKAKGGTDYLILPLFLSRRQQSFFSVATDRPGGFTDEQVQALLDLQTALELRLEILSERQAKQGLLEVYLGQSAARRVLAGKFRRGEGELIRAAIWYCDLRGFTQLSDQRPVREVVPVLDRYFEAVAKAVEVRRGEILKFIGDAALAIFPTDAGGPEEPCRRALAAAEDALERVEKLQEDASLHIGVALHLGEVMFGNIGGRDRLDFTAIGPAVNEVCRVEPLCKTLGVPLLLTGAFRAACGEAETVSLGRFSLRGVSGEHEVFTSARYAPPSAERPS